MAHHQGMGLCAIANRLKGDICNRRLRAEPAVRAVELLLHERVPIDAPEVRQPEEGTEGPAAGAPEAVSRRLTRADTAAPRPHLLSNGHYTVMVTNAGGGWSSRSGMAVTRWRADMTCDPYGTFLFVRDLAAGKAWSAGHQPIPAATVTRSLIPPTKRVPPPRCDTDLLEITVAPDRDGGAPTTLVNHDIEVRTLEVTSYSEVVLDQRADPHPVRQAVPSDRWLLQWDALSGGGRAADQPVFAVHKRVHRFAAGRLSTRLPRDCRRNAADPTPHPPAVGTVGAVLTRRSLRRSAVLAPGTLRPCVCHRGHRHARGRGRGRFQHRSPAAAGPGFRAA